MTALEYLQQLARKDFRHWKSLGDIDAKYHPEAPYVILNYGHAAKFDNEYERLCRGLILEVGTGRIVARPFDKFWNIGERVNKTDMYPEEYLVRAQEKVDGLLGILYQMPDGEWCIATRGSFTGEQATFATEFLHNEYGHVAWDAENTYLFEIVYPENRIVVDYHGREDLPLLAIRHTVIGHYFPSRYVNDFADEHYISTPEIRTFNSLSDVWEATGTDDDIEGWVLWYQTNQDLDYSLWKVKTDAYRERHRIHFMLTDKKVAEYLLNNNMRASGLVARLVDGDPIRADILMQALDIVEAATNELDRVLNIYYTIMLEVHEADPRERRKVFAQHAKDFDERAYLFAEYDEKLDLFFVLRQMLKEDFFDA